ncbi:MAG: 5-formyltetrahydrofolate cyclo-ligase [Spirochaetaceae bacterium]|nr:MAG: 5-formyltetrahydrofolate cyclo-ligase [Spirochaetaceae bacterium]
MSAATKREIRSLVATRIARLSASERTAAGTRVIATLCASTWWTGATERLVYHPLPDEVDTSSLIADDTIFLPRVDGSDLVFHRASAALARHRMGMLEPTADQSEWTAPADGVVCVVCPGRAFDAFGNRIGRGKGYYDRFLRGARTLLGQRIIAVGVCFDEQLFDQLPTTDADERMDAIVCPSRTIIPD